jgi:hypothetical protein
MKANMAAVRIISFTTRLQIIRWNDSRRAKRCPDFFVVATVRFRPFDYLFTGRASHLKLEIDVGKLLTVVVAHDKAGLLLFD